MTKKHAPFRATEHLDELLSETLVHLNRLNAMVERRTKPSLDVNDLLEDRRLLERVDDDVVNMEREVFSEASSLVARMFRSHGMTVSSADVDQALGGTHEQLSELREQLETNVKDALKEFYAGVAALTLETLED